MIILSFRGFNILLPVGYDVQTVPEPLTILGAGSAIAFGTAFKRKLAKAKKQ
ncbi:MAG: PEP-CTERM sorting domain-containing protein [Crocosphaera sp.]|nr:PEP-CTERM sorting domain-containing protein [Crocosphaera sp.]